MTRQEVLRLLAQHDRELATRLYDVAASIAELDSQLARALREISEVLDDQATSLDGDGSPSI